MVFLCRKEGFFGYYYKRQKKQAVGTINHPLTAQMQYKIKNPFIQHRNNTSNWYILNRNGQQINYLDKQYLLNSNFIGIQYLLAP